MSEPTTEDYRVLRSVLVEHVTTTVEERIATVIDPESLFYVAIRAAEQLRGTHPDPLAVLGSAWVDGFMAGAAFADVKKTMSHD